MDVEFVGKIRRWLKKSKSTVNVLYGGAGSGKSYTMAQFLIFYKLAEGNKRILITRKTNPALKISAYQLIISLLREYNIPFALNKADQTVKVGSSEILFKSMDDPEKIKSAEFNYIWMEEATEFTLDDYRQLRLRLRRQTDKKNQIFLTFNPISKNNWVYKEFFETKHKDVAILKTTYKDNGFLDKEYVQTLENLINEDEAYYRVYALGEFVSLKGMIYSNYEIISEIPDHFDEVIYGLDFGYNNPTALIKIGILDERLYILDEMYERGLTNADLIDQLRRIVESTNSSIYADSAEPNRIEEIRRAGFNIYPANKSVKDGIDFVKRHRLYIHASCTNVIKEIESYKWKKDKDGNVLEEPIKFMDHAMDAIRYAIFTHFTQIRTIETANIDIF